MGDFVSYKTIKNINLKQEKIMTKHLLMNASVTVSNTEVKEFVENPGIVKQYLEKYMPALISFLIQLVIAIIVLLVGIKIIKSVVKVIKKAFDRSRMDSAVASFLSNLIKYVLYFVLVMAILSGFGVATGSVVAVLGSAGLTVGLALQGSLSNFAGGVLILLLKPFGIGDYIIDGSSGVEGTVNDVNLFYTHLCTMDNKVVMIPNGKLADSCITNVTAMEKRMLELKVTVSYSTDLSQAKKVLEDVVTSSPAILPDEPVNVFVNELQDSAIELGTRIWVKNADYWTAKWQLTEDIKNALDKNDIEIPFPQLDVNMRQ